MKTITKIGCALIGWNANLLSECGEASHAKFNKLVTAILIMEIGRASCRERV